MTYMAVDATNDPVKPRLHQVYLLLFLEFSKYKSQYALFLNDNNMRDVRK